MTFLQYPLRFGREGQALVLANVSRRVYLWTWQLDHSGAGIIFLPPRSGQTCLETPVSPMAPPHIHQWFFPRTLILALPCSLGPAQLRSRAPGRVVTYRLRWSRSIWNFGADGAEWSGQRAGRGGIQYGIFGEGECGVCGGLSCKVLGPKFCGVDRADVLAGNFGWNLRREVGEEEIREGCG